MLEQLNKLDTKVYFFALVVLVLCFTAFTHNTSMVDLSKMLLASFGTFILGQNSVKQ